ncbi:allophanate hydrolase [Acuticoccus sp. MNP-M23]|uniref:allophanate hydrolase n=1 Tax=Acuticoccus sp. MNP-M23 TaxID=3072793 RepID=UPI0028150441|nr:allophanate hydrolase [Acuticoccus sp. MNP-M23]WMS41049.1 allophanate hydrolase [Acuticoccus sp. MNP-M23]
MTLANTPFTLAGLTAAIAAGTRPAEIVAEVFRRIDAVGDPGIFIHLADKAALMAEAEALGAPDPSRPLWGIPFAVKDNIDVAGMPTTAACPAFAYTPTEDAFVIARLKAAGALVIGKTNLDQFATGLVGVRTPYPVPKNAIDPAIVPGGSSSGSAVAVAHGIVPFALGTDTAGSGRVPAALNNIAGLKPSLGALSATGVVPACRTVDTISIFALTVADAHAVYRVAAAYDAADPWSRHAPAPPLAALPAMTIGIPSRASIDFDGDGAQEANFRAVIAALEAGGATIREIDFTPFFEVAKLLYEGAWVAERHAAIEPMLSAKPEAVHPVTRTVIEKALGLSATDAFRDQYRFAELRRKLEPVLASVDLVCVPTIPTFYTVADLEADPIGPNSRFGTYTNFVNLLDMCGLAVPTVPRPDGRPGSVTLLAPHGRDGTLASLGVTIEALDPARPLGATGSPLPKASPLTGGASENEIEIAVCGAHMSGMALNHQLTSRGGRFLRAVDTTPDYRLFALPGGPPERPGLIRVANGGSAIAVEVWTLPLGEVGSFLAGIPAPLGLGTTTLADGTSPRGFICEGIAADTADDVSAYGSWRNYTARPVAMTG